MKGELDAILRPEQARYLERLLPPRDALLREMEAHSEREKIPSSDPEVGHLLEVLVRARGARRGLEIGTAIGYGTLSLLRGSPEIRVASVDPDPRRLAAARGYLEKAGVLARAELVEGKALDVLPSLAGPFDIVYVDALKTEYRRYLDLTLPLLAVGGLVVVDNLLWKGRIAAPPAGEEPTADDRAIAAFNPYFLSHPQLRSLILPLGDGVGLGVKTQPLILEMGGPF
ncbi:MAG: O-methyltransferase [Acidobacteriota bacterium]